MNIVTKNLILSYLIVFDQRESNLNLNRRIHNILLENSDKALLVVGSSSGMTFVAAKFTKNAEIGQRRCASAGVGRWVEGYVSAVRMKRQFTSLSSNLLRVRLIDLLVWW